MASKGQSFYAAKRNLHLRPYSERDWAAICAIYDAAKPQELRAAGIEKAFVPLRNDPDMIKSFSSFTTTVCENEEGEIIGYAGYHDDYIGWLFVDPAWQRRGVGRTLLEELLSNIRSKPWLWVLQGNQAAYALYASEGFVAVGAKQIRVNGCTCAAVKLVGRETPRPPEKS